MISVKYQRLPLDGTDVHKQLHTHTLLQVRWEGGISTKYAGVWETYEQRDVVTALNKAGEPHFRVMIQ
jgi:hypothetical protein